MKSKNKVTRWFAVSPGLNIVQLIRESQLLQQRVHKVFGTKLL